MQYNCRLGSSIEYFGDSSGTSASITERVAEVLVNQGLTTATCCLPFPSST